MKTRTAHGLRWTKDGDVWEAEVDYYDEEGDVQYSAFYYVEDHPESGITWQVELWSEDDFDADFPTNEFHGYADSVDEAMMIAANYLA